MQVSKVSFGSLVTVYGKPKAIAKIDKNVYNQAMIKDVTSIFQASLPSFVLADAARKGNKVKLYITGEERRFVEAGKQGWKTISNLLDNIRDPYNANEMSTKQISGIITGKINQKK